MMHKGRTYLVRQANILSFDEAKRDVGSSRRSAVPPNPPTCFTNDLPEFESPFRQAAVTSRLAPVRQTTATRAPRRTNAQNLRPSWLDDNRASTSRAAGSRSARTTDARVAYQQASRANEDRVEESPDEDVDTKRLSRFAAFRRAREKDKAERAFTKQYGGADKSADAPQSGPRAAVYKTEMGATHRRAARMQNKASPQAATKQGFSLSRFASLKSSPKFIVSAAVAACLALSCVFLYPAAQQYYQAVRDRDRLTAEYTALEQRNAAIEGEVSSLQTDAGIEQVAHEQLGWVKPGEETANVRGLDLPKDELELYANITSSSVEAPETWYSPLLDLLFGVE